MTTMPRKLTRQYRPIFSEKHLRYIRACRTNMYNIAEGSIRAGKTVDNVFAFCTELEDTPDRLHLASASTVATAKLNLIDCNGMGMEAIFRGRCRWGKYKGNDCLRVQTRTGTKIVIFAGAGKADSYKRIRGNSYGMWIATEINLLIRPSPGDKPRRWLRGASRKRWLPLVGAAPLPQTTPSSRRPSTAPPPPGCASSSGI